MQASRSVLPPLPWKTEAALKGSGWVGVAPPPGQRGSASAPQLSRGKKLKNIRVGWYTGDLCISHCSCSSILYHTSILVEPAVAWECRHTAGIWEAGGGLMSRIPTISYSMGSSRVNVNSCVVWSHHPLSTNRHTYSVFFFKI